MTAQTGMRHFICRAVLETAKNARLTGATLFVVAQLAVATCWGQNAQLSPEVEELVTRPNYQSTDKFLALLREKGVTEPSHLEPYLEKVKSQLAAMWERGVTEPLDLEASRKKAEEFKHALAHFCLMVRHAKPEERHRASKYLSEYASKQQVPHGASKVSEIILRSADHPFALEYFNLRIEKADAWELGVFFGEAFTKYDDWIKASDQAEAVVRRAVGQLPEALRKTPTGDNPVWYLLSMYLNNAPFTKEEFALPIIDASSKALEKPGTLTSADIYAASEILMNRYRQLPDAVQRRVIDLVRGGSSNRARIIWWHVIRLGYGDEKSRSELKDSLLEQWPALREFVNRVEKEDFKTDPWGAPELRVQIETAHAEERREVLKSLSQNIGAAIDDDRADQVK